MSEGLLPNLCGVSLNTGLLREEMALGAGANVMSPGHHSMVNDGARAVQCIA